MVTGLPTARQEGRSTRTAQGMTVLQHESDAARTIEMNARVAEDRAELIKWLDALELFLPLWGLPNVGRGLEMARQCRHPDAQWLCSLFPVGAETTQQAMLEVLWQQGEDPRGLFVTWKLRDDASRSLLRRSAELGYAPAQALVALYAEVDGHEEAFEWCQKAGAKGDRAALFVLSKCYRRGLGCVADEAKAYGLLRESVDLGYPPAQWCFGVTAFELHEWESFYWRARAAHKGYSVYSLSAEILHLLPAFERCEKGRILHCVAPLVAAHLDAASGTLLGCFFDAGDVRLLLRVAQLHEAMLQRARHALRCWSVAGRRSGLVRDVRIIIAKMAWDEVWRWGDGGSGSAVEKSE
jgi:hypothetical protein